MINKKNIMRVRLIGKMLNKGVLPWNYKKVLSSMVFGLMPENTNIHGGHIGEFTFSNIEFLGKYSQNKMGFEYHSGLFTFDVSSFNNEVIKSLKESKGEFLNLGRDFFFLMQEVQEVCLEKVDSNTIFYSEFLLRKNIEKKTGGTYKLSISPGEPEFNNAFFSVLIKKYRNVTGDDDTKFDVDKMLINTDYKGRKNQSGLEVSLEGRSEVKDKYFKLNFTLDCPDILKKVAYINGVGAKTNMGFGFVNLK